MKRLVFLLRLCLAARIAFPLAAQIANVSVVGITNTQAILQYSAPDSSPCTVAVSASPTYSPLVHDVDPAIFAGSNLDNRTGTISAGVSRTFVIGTRDSEQGLNGHWYSRALQALTSHYYQITCGTYTATGSFTTSNIALGNTYNEALPPAPNAGSNGYSYTGQYAWPEFLNWNTADPTARQEAVIDPQTGMLLKRLTMPQDWGWQNDGAFLSTFAPTGGWTNVNSLLADDSSYASYSGTSSDWLAMTDPTLVFSNGNTLESLTFSMKAWCSGVCAGENAKVQVCLTVNGVSCWPTAANVYDVVLGTGSLPATFTTYGGGAASMSAWTPPGIPPLVSFDSMKRSGIVNVDAAGNVTWKGGNFFYPGWTAGSAITIGSSVCTIASLTNPQALSITPGSCSPALTLPANGVVYSAGNFGVMLRKKTSSTDTINVQYAKYTLGVTAAMSWASGGQIKICSSTVTQNTVTGHLGFHCVLGNTPQVYWIDSTTGDANWLGPLYTGSQDGPDGWQNRGCSGSSVTLSGTSPTSPETYYCPAADRSGNAIILGCTLTTTNQTGNMSTTCQNMTRASTGKDYLSLLVSFTSGYPPSFDPAQFNADSIGIAGMQNGQLLVHSYRGYQDTAAWMTVFNPKMIGTAPGCVGGGLPGCVVAAQNTWSTAPCRWCTMHTDPYSGESNSWVLIAKYLGDWIGMPGGGAYTSTVTSPALTATPSIAAGTAGCPSGSRGCDLVTVDGEPCNMQPAGTIGGHPADPLNCPKNPGWSYLQDAAPGDVLNTQTGPLEFMRLISKNGNQWLMERGVGYPGVVTPQTPILLMEDCLVRDDGFNHGVSALNYIWDYGADPHGLNASGTTLRVQYAFDHEVINANSVIGDGPWYDPSSHGLGYAIQDGPGFGFGSPNKYAHMGPPFAGSLGVTPFNEAAQDHPSHSQYNAPAAEQNWFLDARPLSGPGPSMTDQATPVSGQLYKFASTAIDGDNLTYVGGPTAQQSSVSRKLQATMMFCGTQPLIDISSAAQGNVIGTGPSSAYQYCVARKAGECRGGSAVGDVYANCPFVNPRTNYPGYGCNNVFSENGLGNDLCINNTGAYLNGLIQIGYPNAYDATGAGGRLLTHGLIHYRLNDVNQSVRTTPDGLWLLFDAFNLGSEFEILSGKMLPYPPVDSINRATFIPMIVQLTPPAGLGVDNAIVQFGYAENGGPNQFYCTTRREACLVASAAVGTVPFQFPSDGSNGTAGGLAGASCASGCSVAIPALSQRVVYYQVLYRDSSNHVVAQTQLQAVATP